MLEVFTARIGTRDPDTLDITRKSGAPDGLAFAPSWEILSPVLALRSKATRLDQGAHNAMGQGQYLTAVDLRRQATVAAADLEKAWDAYVGAYTEEMRRSFFEKQDAWRALLARKRVVLLCYCPNHQRCHRTLLGRDILTKLGATYHGELTSKQREIFNG